MAKTDIKLPPQDIEAEGSLLGALLLDKNAVVAVADSLVPYDFYGSSHQKIYAVVLDLFDKGEPIDIMTVSSALKTRNMLEEVGGLNYLTDLVESVPTAAHAAHYAQLVKEKKVRRDLISISAEINEKAFAGEEMPSLLDAIEQRVFGVLQNSQNKKFTPISEELGEAYERIEKLHQGEGGGLRGVPTLFTELDNKLSGLQKSDLIILGARPSFGKTTFALDIARNAASIGKIVGIFSLEMSREQIIDRLIASEAQVPLWKLRTGRLNLKEEGEFAMIQRTLDQLSKMPIFIDDSPSPNIIQMRSMARKLQLEHGLDLLVIDYLQLINPIRPADSLVHQVTEISRGLKSLARELNIPVIAVSQLSRAVEAREDGRPKLADLRESGSLEQDADVVLFLHRRDRNKKWEDVPPDHRNIVEVIISKHRNGPIGDLQLRFDQDGVSFKNIDTVHSESF